jgi:hypothetical protein
MKQKMLEYQLNSWSMMFSSGMLESMPSIISGDEVSKLYCNLLEQLGLPVKGTHWKGSGSCVENGSGSFPWSDKKSRDAYIEESTCDDSLSTTYTKAAAEASSPGNVAYDKYLEGFELLGECTL